MKKIILIFALSSAFLSYSQEENETTTKKSKVKSSLYIGIGGQFLDNYNLNSKLKASNVAELKTSKPEFLFGFKIFGQKYSGDLEVGVSQTENENSSTQNKDISYTTRLRFHYNLINKEKIAFTTGISLSGTSSEVDLFAKNNTIDFNDLNPNFNGGLITVRNQMYYVGPSASLYLLKNKNYSFRINFGYEFAFTNGKWISDYANINNTVKEQGNNRFLIGFILN